ncbi:ATP-dependent RNA helicase [Tanacetum coccineum]
MEPPSERHKGHNSSDEIYETIQLWAQSNELCPEGTIPIRRTTEKDVLRGSSLRRFGRKIRGVRRDTSSGGHEASMNVWTPSVTNAYEFSVSQLWVISGSFGNDLNTIEAGWQIVKCLLSFDETRPSMQAMWLKVVHLFIDVIH